MTEITAHRRAAARYCHRTSGCCEIDKTGKTHTSPPATWTVGAARGETPPTRHRRGVSRSQAPGEVVYCVRCILYTAALHTHTAIFTGGTEIRLVILPWPVGGQTRSIESAQTLHISISVSTEILPISKEAERISFIEPKNDTHSAKIVYHLHFIKYWHSSATTKIK